MFTNTLAALAVMAALAAPGEARTSEHDARLALRVGGLMGFADQQPMLQAALGLLAVAEGLARRIHDPADPVVLALSEVGEHLWEDGEYDAIAAVCRPYVSRERFYVTLPVPPCSELRRDPGARGRVCQLDE